MDLHSRQLYGGPILLETTKPNGENGNIPRRGGNDGEKVEKTGTGGMLFHRLGFPLNFPT